MSESSPKQIGKTFAFVFWGLFLVIMYQLFDSKLTQQVNPNQQPESYSSNGQQVLVLQRNRYGHYVTSGFINHQPVTFLLDTGATNVAVPKAVADRLGLAYGREVRTHTANGVGRSYLTKVEQLSLGEIQLYDVNASIAAGMTGEEILLGMSALKQLEFSQRGDQLTLKTLTDY